MKSDINFQFDETDISYRPLPQNRLVSESKLRRNPKYCPICLNKLVKNAKRTRLIKSCLSCKAHPSLLKRCAKCQAEAIWENSNEAACRACGLHGKKSLVIASDRNKKV